MIDKFKILILFIVGISGVISLLIFDHNPLFFISPAPSVFTYQNKFKSHISFIRSSKNQKVDNISMNRKFYRSLKGPHRYKVIFNSVMKRGGRLVKLPEYNKFVLNFICKYKAKTNITKVEVVTKKRSLKVFNCYD